MADPARPRSVRGESLEVERGGTLNERRNLLKISEGQGRDQYFLLEIKHADFTQEGQIQQERPQGNT